MATQSRQNFVSGFALVAAAGVMWGLDGALRVPLIQSVPASVIVLIEHAILVVLTVPLLRGVTPMLRRLDVGDWLSLVAIGAGASTVATTLFTESLNYGQINTTLILQKLQPAVVLIAAWSILGERPQARYWLFFVPAVGGAWLLTFRDPLEVSVVEAAPALLALGAAILWGMGTVLGRRLSPRMEFQQLTAVRFLIGLPSSALVVTIVGDWGTLDRLEADHFLSMATTPSGVMIPGGLLLVTLIPGLLAMLAYYRGLDTTPAILATLAELAFPLTAVVVNTLLALNYQPPDASQWVGVGMLAAAITALGIVSASARSDAAGVQGPSLT